ncbi:MAG: hypothetical protein A2268_09305 [Candidatus Raymondbacteria bacterium RifOxyA12_full_50_37]|uniref:F5/8 type C domain-containing protein n=1 Tax=Candidatus Raymondbacteria bacterium RIFOXYD12_FULL_49_13 TaxID=1817890 RepID=A0A1F7FJR7_UNCRA|nr:MAG: hypothetical protein A2268_09305 [Candidatus Raymondbacteria bacterium RifOxyA12_full_50_37]OGJ90570.1 MAG: hypothetical protein A2248_10250 [Candidatus Raymondbacteria bacterium RIFOXYA2_FULL_49_16]OGJ98106.1 MAG: hypothetical protein A2453_09350 [Candidatus Raymondbacteria bacterium RIFOXYC2_FULL_50_21]OGK06702.1 MAG: hypothetical protein A2519_18695 [Candidatus Raymondbacteria bacterium RIFOXYD12_FULL_49_13]OGP43312.1 MAG: hypothetical protein A2324_01340 [Candidatus Raymondbacteria 
MKTYVLLLVSLFVLKSLSLCQTVFFASFPQKNQLYARDAQDSASVTVSGSVTSAGSDSVTLTVLKNGGFYQYYKQALVYNADSAPFAFSARLHAGLASYKFELRVNATLVSSADSVLSGDAYLVDGQSNAATAEIYDYPKIAFYSPWLRTFSLSDTAWHRSITSSWCLATHIIENDSIPVCFINGAVGGTSISQHQRDTSLSSIYGKIYFRITRAGLRNGIRAMLWYQGEAENGDSLYNAVGYATSFKAVHDAWLGDCPGIQHFYVFQIRPGCGSGFQDILRDCQRRLPNLLSDVSLMSTTNVADRNADNCHYLVTGLHELGDMMYRLLARDMYSSTDTVHITPPNIQKAWYVDDERTRLVLQFDQPVLLPADTNMKKFFAVQREWNVADSLSADTAAHTVTLYMRNGAAEGDGVSYIPPEFDPFTGLNYNGPWLSNTRGIGPLTFFQFPIENKDPYDSLTALSMQAFAHDSVLEQYDTTRVSAVTAYSTGKIDTTEKECVYTSLNTFIATVSVFGQVIAKNTGTARIRVSKRGFLDTVSIRIVSTTALLDSIRLSEHQKNVALIGFTLKATGYYRKGDERFSANIDTVVNWVSGLPITVSVIKGVVRHVAGNSPAPIPVVASLSGVSDTCLVTAPWLVPRTDMRLSINNTYSTGFSAAYVFDSTRASWLSSAPPPQPLDIAFTQSYRITKLFYLPWQDNRLNGVITQYVILRSLDSVFFDTLASGAWSLDLAQKEAVFPATDARYVRLMAMSANNGHVNADEIGFQRADTSTTSIMDETMPLPTTAFSVAPNPFNPSLNITCALTKAGDDLRISIFSIDGQKIRTLHHGHRIPGRYRVIWDGRDNAGNLLASGIYVVALNGPMLSLQKKVLFLK